MQYANGCFFDYNYSHMYSQRMTIGDRLDKAMKAAKIESQSALARRSGVPQATISRILKGEGRRGPETETIKKLAAACSVTFEWLNEGRGPSEAGSGKAAKVEGSPPVAQNDDLVPAAEIKELIQGYCDAAPKERKHILALAKVAIRHAALRRENSALDQR